MADERRKLPSPRKIASLKRGDEPGCEELAPPPEAAQEQIAAHLAEHGISPFNLSDHVHLGGKRLETQIITWDPGKATFHCQPCPHQVFATEAITEEMIDLTLLWDDGVKPFLAGAKTEAERREVARAYRSGDLSTELLGPWRKQQRRRPAAPRPSVEHRRRSVQTWMLARYAEVGIVERVLEEAIAMQKDLRDEWELLSDRDLTMRTLRRYWQLIPAAEVAAAKAAHEQRRKEKLV